MKVLVCIPCLLTGGTEIQTLSLVNALIAAGHTVTVACYFEWTEAMVSRYRASGAEVRSLSAEGVRPQGIKATATHLWKGLKPVVKEMRPEIAHIQYMAPGAIPILILRALGVKNIVATAHTGGDIYTPGGLKLISMVNNRLIRAWQCITLRAENSFFGSSKMFNTDISLKRHGNHFTIYNSLPSYISVRKETRTFDAGITIGVVSRLEPIKGMDMVIPAFAEVHKAHPNTRLLIVGDGSQRELMEGQVYESGLADYVEFVGRQGQDALQDYYDSIDVLLVPSRSEGVGLTAIEGMARGCVVVASDTGGLPEVVTVDSGILFKSEDTNNLHAKLMSVLSSPEILKKLSAAAIQRAETFSTERYNAQIRALYGKI